jgi:hypothetical protein
MKKNLKPIERLRIIFQTISERIKSDRPSTSESQTPARWIDTISQSINNRWLDTPSQSINNRWIDTISQSINNRWIDTISQSINNRWLDTPSQSINNQWLDTPSQSINNQWLDTPSQSQTDYLWLDLPSQSQTDYLWLDSLEPSLEDDPSSDRDFLNPNDEEDVANMLRRVIGTRDPYSQEEFTSGQKVYFCRRHRLTFHEDTWIELESKCPECGSDRDTTPYILPEI